jgi:hypothetical protein
MIVVSAGYPQYPGLVPPHIVRMAVLFLGWFPPVSPCGIFFWVAARCINPVSPVIKRSA